MKRYTIPTGYYVVRSKNGKDYEEYQLSKDWSTLIPPRTDIDNWYMWDGDEYWDHFRIEEWAVEIDEVIIG